MTYTNAMKNPVVVALANLIIPGLGYLIVQRRVVFGWLLLAGSVLGIAWSFLYPMPPFAEATEFLLCTTAYALTAVAFAYDAYQEAKHAHKSN